MKVFVSLAIASGLILMSCVSAEQKQERQWSVKVSTNRSARVWMNKLDGSVQCENRPVITPESATSELKAAGVNVFSARKGYDGMMHLAVCGDVTGATVEVEIASSDEGLARALGYNLIQKQN
ncbi:MAG: hypothetical protein M9962_02285 [Oligoflexia bacterium]|nr:hypothetical protein [Oligoflexia bacterium]